MGHGSRTIPLLLVSLLAPACQRDNGPPPPGPCAITGVDAGYAVGCPAPITTASGPATYEEAMAAAQACGMSVASGTCGPYKIVELSGRTDLGQPYTTYYFDPKSGSLVAVTQLYDLSPSMCVAGPANFAQPCCDPDSPGSAYMTPICDGGDDGPEGGT